MLTLKQAIDEEAYNKPIQQRKRMSMQTIKMRVTQGYSMIDYQQWENTRVYWSRGDIHAPGKIFFSARTKFKQDYEPVH